MAKYVIEIPDNTHWIQWIMEGTKDHHPYMDWKLVEDLTPYTEPDEQEIRQKEEEYGEKAWQLFRNICELNGTECIEAFDTISCRTVLDEMTYSEAKAKYEEWRKRKDEIRVGCEVRHKELPELKIYVTDMNDNSFGGFALCRVEDVCDYGDRFSECNVHSYKPTGRMLPNIVELLKKMGEG